MVVFSISFMTTAKDMTQAFTSGCEAYLIKPLSKAKLIERLRELGLVESPDGNNESPSEDSVKLL